MNDKITIILTEEQRDLLIEYEPYFVDDKVFKLISIAIKKENKYEIYLDEEELEELIDQVAELANNEKDEVLKYQLDDICDFLEDVSDDLQDSEDDEDSDYSEFSQETGSVFILKVSLAYEKEIWRKIAIREGQSLHDLHMIIFEAFDRFEDHMYSFFINPTIKKFDPRKIYKSADEYTHPFACEEEPDKENAEKTTIGSLNLKEKERFYYLFDFGDEWWHEITVEQTDGEADDDEYPRVIEEQGESPEQYEDYDEDFDDEED